MKVMSIPENATEMEFAFLTGDVDWQEYGGKWISNKLNNGDFDYWVVLEFINWLDATGETYNDNEFLVSLASVAPSEVSKEEMDQAIGSMGWPENDDNEPDDIAKVEILSSYGILAHLWQEEGNDADLLLKRARQAANVVTGLFGFFMDTQQNAIGSTGWDFIKGDIMAGLYK